MKKRDDDPNEQSSDRVYAEPLDRVPPFEFDARVADVFPDMIRRSVPGYGTVLAMLGVLSRRYVQPDSRCYDLGCSLGAATLAMRHNVTAPGVSIIAVDSSGAMVQRCRGIVQRDASPIPVEVVEADIRDMELADASLVVMSYTLQFLPPDHRQALLERIHAGLRPGGALVLSEKVRFEQLEQDQLHHALHHEFKRACGYSDLEISQKRSALENVLIRDSLEQHHARLRTAGFMQSTTWFQCFNFASLLAVRAGGS